MKQSDVSPINNSESTNLNRYKILNKEIEERIIRTQDNIPDSSIENEVDIKFRPYEERLKNYKVRDHTFSEKITQCNSDSELLK